MALWRAEGLTLILSDRHVVGHRHGAIWVQHDDWLLFDKLYIRSPCEFGMQSRGRIAVVVLCDSVKQLSQIEVVITSRTGYS